MNNCSSRAKVANVEAYTLNERGPCIYEGVPIFTVNMGRGVPIFVVNMGTGVPILWGPHIYVTPVSADSAGMHNRS